MQQFVPLTDDHLETVVQSRLVPYNVGQPCFHWEIDDATQLPDELQSAGSLAPRAPKTHKSATG